jgi:methionine synthase II (cobalamin-independent)
LKNLSERNVDPLVFLENINLMKERLAKIIGHFGGNRVPYAGPECGLRGFPTYESALECLRRVSKVVKEAKLMLHNGST